MVPGRAGAGTQAIIHIPISQLRQMPGGSGLEDAWIRGRPGEDGYLAGKDAETAACDAMIVPVVTGRADLTVVDKMIALALAATGGGHRAGHAIGEATDDDSGGSDDTSDGGRSRELSPEAWAALRYAMARLAVDLVSGPAGLAATLRTGLLDAPWNTCHGAHPRLT